MGRSGEVNWEQRQASDESLSYRWILIKRINDQLMTVLWSRSQNSCALLDDICRVHLRNLSHSSCIDDGLVNGHILCTKDLKI